MNYILDIKDISFGYKKDKLLFDSFSLTLKEGELKAIVGKSGAGKSTIFELILKSLKPFSGTISVTNNISEVFQDPYSSFHPNYKLINQIKDVASLENLKEYMVSLNIDDGMIEKLPHQLSGGQLQRISILRAMLMKPKLLLLDEPTSALDNIIQLDVMKMLLKYNKGIGMLLITHDLDLARWCSDEIIEI